MGKLTWREIKKLKVPDPTASVWTAALDYVTPGKLYRIAVKPVPVAGQTDSREQQWKPESGNDCSADGDASLTRTPPLIIDTCAVGALIGKIGGSTADTKIDSAKLVLFSVGRHCVFSLSDPVHAGSLYLGMNDAMDSISKLQGQLEVTLDEAL